VTDGREGALEVNADGYISVFFRNVPDAISQ